MDPRRGRRPYVTAHELGQFVYCSDGNHEARVAREGDLQRGLRVHAGLQAAHMGRSIAAERSFPWDWVGVGAFLLMVLGVALWTH
ncbi:MAG: hypothetical protein KGJ23_12680 [Euryarchaeota archaeon]|nr:hypothetical protein [Euryarchaeota archaeon]MDE1837454.1 hypothetical protein [Euryarchaeota archaeon]MDE1881873.1 hypothetical protein [Euryarchaeota archaeon]MDE2045580.1 hypothetical protein [Thermoplasmata archaeon]